MTLWIPVFFERAHNSPFIPAPLESLGFFKRLCVRLRLCKHPKIPNPIPCGKWVYGPEEDRSHGTWTPVVHGAGVVIPLLLIKESHDQVQG